MTTARELRGQVRDWRRGRADARLIDQLQDLYVGVLATLLLGSMVVSVVVHIGGSGNRWCTTAGCHEARAALPWIAGLVALAGVLALARAIGPVMVTPATASWLLTTPVDRAALLRPRWLLAAAAAVVGGGVVATAGTTLAGASATVVTAWSLAVAAGSLVVLLLAAWQQARSPWPLRLLTMALATLGWLCLLTIATGSGPRWQRPTVGTAWICLACLAILAVGTAWPALVTLRRLRPREVSFAGSLTSALSGALAALDLAMVYDVLIAHRWVNRGQVRPLRMHLAGPAALIGTDLIRLRRAPGRLVWLAAGVLAPYATLAIGAGRVVPAIAILVGFVACVPMLVGLRVLDRSPGLARLLPIAPSAARRVSLVVPALALLVYAAATVPAVHAAGAQTWSAATGTGLAVLLGALAAATRWVTGRPPDYSRPLVSTPAGGVPTNLYGSGVRGFDIWVLVSAPLIIAPAGGASLISELLSLAVLAYLTGRR